MNIHGEAYLTEMEEATLLHIARDTLSRWVAAHARIQLKDYALTPALKEKHAVFVTLRNQGELRGCVGYTSNRDPLAEAVRENTINAASHDSRFDPVLSDELDDIAIEISALTPGDTPDTPFKRIRNPDEIVIGRDGLFVRYPGVRGGLLLPQVATDRGWGLDEFLRMVCRKAGYAEDAWRDPTIELYRFSAQVFSEEERG